MNRLLLLGSACLALLYGTYGCQAQAAHAHDHWSEYSVGNSMARHFLSYDAEADGNYRDFAWKKKQAINLTLRRHLFNNNPDNPFEPYDPRVNAPRPINSLVPHPENYIHLEGLATGLFFYASGGLFVPLPIDSIIGTFEKGGDKEFMQGVDQFTKPLGVATATFLHDGLGTPETKGSDWRH